MMQKKFGAEFENILKIILICVTNKTENENKKIQ